MQHTPFYDPTKSYEENYEKGPFGAFASPTQIEEKTEPTHTFLGQPVYTPFGIPAGPLLNSTYLKSAFEMGFDICVYKTVRSQFFPCHPFPNVLSVNVEDNLTIEKASQPLVANTNYSEPLSITNSFGVPSRPPEVWQEDVKKAISYAKKGQLLIHSFMGTVKPNQTQEELIEDFVLAAKLSKETGAKVLEVNLSCPNIGNEGLICYNLSVTARILEKLRSVIGNTPLVVKVGYFQKDAELTELARIIAAHADAISTINTIPATIVDDQGNQALPGPQRLKSGVCGQAIQWAGLEMVSRLRSIQKEHSLLFGIIGVGGVMNPKDYDMYMKAGADVVMSATGAMWNPYLAQEIKQRVQDE